MSEEKGNLLIRLALILILLALLLLFHNWWEDFSAGNASHSVISDMQSVMETQNVETERKEEAQRPLQMQEMIIDGYAYIGYLHIPALEVELPVLSEWSDEGLKIAPARHFGAVLTNDLVIAAHNYRRHFGALGTLRDGDEVTFTEMDGFVNHYIVRKVVTIQGTDLQEVMYNPYDLVLYTCTTGGKKRLAAYCERVKE